MRSNSGTGGRPFRVAAADPQGRLRRSPAAEWTFAAWAFERNRVTVPRPARNGVGFLPADSRKREGATRFPNEELMQ